MPRWMSALICLLLLAVAAPAFAQEDEAGLKDHPLLARMPGYFINDGQVLDFGALDLTLPDDTTRHVEGKFTRLQYILKDGARNPGAVAVARNYGNALKARGGTVLYENVDNGGGYLSAKATIGAGTLWLEVSVNNSGEGYELRIIEQAEMAQQIELTADAMAAALADTGRVALRSIQFDTAKATLKPESSAVLDQVVTLLKNDEALMLEVQGHTDNVGLPAANLKLSKERAAAVKDYLVTRGGIAAARLTTTGFGDTKPLAPNTTDEGRAENRRVELVRK